jgi:tetratricopeptide (TPR) repeat protein
MSFQRPEEEDYLNYSKYLSLIKQSIKKVNKIQNPAERENQLEETISEAIDYVYDITDEENRFEAGELLYSIGEVLENMESVPYSHALKIYDESVSIWKDLIEQYKRQGKLHEISELFLRIADIYRVKYENTELERKYILKSIKFLKQETELLEHLNEGRKLPQNYQNIAELYYKLSKFEKAIEYYKKVIYFGKHNNFIDILPYSYRQISECYRELDQIRKSKEVLFNAVDFFMSLYHQADEKNDYSSLAQVCQILKSLFKSLKKKNSYIHYSKKEAGAYLSLAERMKEEGKELHKIARYYRGAALCYKDIESNLLESASCFVLAGNYCVKLEDYNQAVINYSDAANLFQQLENYEQAYKHFMKAGDYYWKIENYDGATNNYLNAYEAAIEGNIEFNKYGLFNQIIRGLHKIAGEGLKSKEFYKAASLILESIKFYEQLESSKDFLLEEMIKNTYKYYYRAANLSKISYSHIVNSYIVAALSLILIGKLEKSREMLSEIDSEGTTIKIYKKMIRMIIERVKTGKEVDIDCFPFQIKRLIQNSIDIKYLISLFSKVKSNGN